MNIPKSLFESLQASLNQEAKRLCREAARKLKVPEKEVQEKILKKMPKMTIHEDKEQSFSCPVFVENKLLERCRLPCVLGTGRCLNHQASTIPDPTTHKILTRIQPTEDSPDPLWCDETDGTIYNKESSVVGLYKNSVLILYNLSKE